MLEGMQFHSRDHNQDYPTLRFTMDLSFQSALDSRTSPCKILCKQFADNGIRLSPTATLSIQHKGSRWRVIDTHANTEYYIIKTLHTLDVHQNLHVVNQIVDRDLCVRCGACEPACPVDIIRFNERAYPYITDESRCILTCTRCLKVCPGEIVNFSSLDRDMFSIQPHPDSITGIAKRAYVSYATDRNVRDRGTSGGLVTQILRYMLERKLIDGALVLGVSTAGGSWHQQPFIARTVADLTHAAKSKYLAVPFLQPLGEIEKVQGNYAVVGLPCYVHALRKYQKVSRKLRERIKLIIGLYCNVVFEPYLFDDVCSFNGIRKEEVANLHFRHGVWPGGVVAELSDGANHKVMKLEEMKDEFNLLKLLYTAPRCNMCIDFSAEYADLAVGDPWLRGPDGKYLFEDGRTTVLVRTEVGNQILHMAAESGYIHLQEIPLKTYMVNFETSGRYKRDFVPKNIMMRRLLKLPVPDYHRPIGRGKFSGFLPMLLKTAILWMARFKWFRRLSTLLAQTGPAITYFAWNRKRKESRFAAAYPRLESFVEKLSPTRLEPDE